jgi:hypothetical protein
VEFYNVRSLLLLARVSGAMRNVAYNAVCLFNKFVQILQAEFECSKRRRIMSSQRLIEYGCDVHGGGSMLIFKLWLGE